MAAVHRCDEYELQGLTSLLTLSPFCLAITNPEPYLTYDIIAVYGASELELKVICVTGNSTIFLLVASFLMEKNKRYSYDAGYKLKIIAYVEEHGNRAAERHFGPPPTEKTIRDWRASKEELEKMTVFREFQAQFGFLNNVFFKSGFAI